MRPINCVCHLACYLALLWSPSSIALGQDALALSDEERSSLLAERDLKAEQAISLANTGEFKQSLVLLEEVFKIEQSVFGEAHEELLGTLDLQARIARFGNDWKREIEFRRLAQEIGRVLYEKDNYRLRDLQQKSQDASDNSRRTDQQRRQLSQADTLNSEAIAHFQQGKSAEAIGLAKQAVDLRREVLGKSHPDYGQSLNNLALLHQSLGDYAQAAPLYLEAKTILEKALGKEHALYAASVNNIAALYQSMGDYERAEPLYIEAKTIREKVLGKEHPDYSQSLNNLAVLYEAMGDFVRAEPLFMAAKTIRARVLDKEHPDYAVSLHNLAFLYESMGNYARAEPLYVEAMTILEKALGNEHPHYATTLISLAGLYSSMGDYARAEPLTVEAMKIFQQAYGKKHPHYATSVNNLAELYRSMGDYARAEPLYVQAKTIREQVLGKNHPHYATTLNTLAGLYDSMGDCARAEPLYIEAMTIRENVFGKEHSEYAVSLNNLAGLYVIIGDYGRAETLFVEAINSQEKVLGKAHPNYANSLNSLASLYAAMDDGARADPLYRDAIDITLGHLEMTASVQSEQQQLLISQSLRYQLDNYVTCCLSGDFSADDVIERIIGWKGSVLRRGRGLRLASSDPAVADKFRQLQSLASQISVTTRSIPEPKQINVWQKRLDSLGEQRRELETELTRLSPAFGESVAKIGLDDVRQSIPEGGIFVDFLEYSGKDGRGIVASVIPRSGEPRLISLGSAEEAGASIDAWRKSFGMAAEAKLAGESLRRQIWQPLWEHVHEADLVLVSTDGVLGRMPLAALPGREPGTFLIEDHRLVLIPVPQLLPSLVREQEANTLSHELLLVGNVDYGAPAAGRSDHVEPLPETALEVEFIRKLFARDRQNGDPSIVDLREGAATESALREHAPHCRSLHLATHGFFAAADKKNALSPAVIAQSRGPMHRSSMFGDQHDFVRGVSPGQLSGLVFASANRPLQPIDPLSNDHPVDDGIMTADEIAYLPLDGVELAVLSACETGLGEVAGGEGLIGIQRAFQVSGVDSVVATMWKVDDRMTRKLMERFYLNYLDGKMSKLDALREAQLWMLNSPQELGVDDATTRGAVRDAKPEIAGDNPYHNRTSPYFWAAFTLSGDWR